MPNPNTSIFPGAVATDTDFFVVKDNAFSPLSGNIDDIVTDIPVVDASVFNFPCLIAIGNEIVKAAGPRTGNTINNCTRGYRGTTAAGHNSGVIVFGYIFDWTINQLEAEIKAIESQLGINLTGVVKAGATAGGDLSGTYPNPLVATVGGASAANVADAVSKRHTQNTDIGTNSNTFQVGSGGPKAKNISASAMDLRNAADSDWADITIKALSAKGAVAFDDNIITLIASISGITAPTLNAGFEVIRGTQPTVDLIWNEGTQKFQCGVQGAEHDIIIQGYGAGGDLSGSYPNPSLANTAVTPGAYGDGTHVGQFTVDSKGRLTAAAAVAITGAAPTGSAGGDLTGTYPNPTVATVGALAAASVASGATAANDATNANTVSKIVKRDANGDFALRYISLAHIIGTSTAPGIAPNTGAGTSPTVALTGTDSGGKISVTPGAGPATSASIADITFATTFASAPSAILIAPGNAAAAALTTARPFVTSLATTGFTLQSNTAALTNGTAYIWYFIVIG